MSLVQEFEKFRESITQNTKVSFVSEKYNPPLDADEEDITAELLELNSKFKQPLTMGSELYDLVRLLAGASLAWKCTTDDGEFIYGSMRFNDLWSILSLKSDFWKAEFSLSFDEEVPDNLKYLEKLNWFERQSWSDDQRYGCFIRDDKFFPPKLAFYDKDWYTELSITLDEYFQAMFNSCAIKGWQYFYIDWTKDIPHKEEALEDMEMAVKYLPKLFPQKDFSYHVKKLEKIKSENK